MKNLGNIEYKRGWVQKRNPEADKLHNKFSYAEKNGLKIGGIGPAELGESLDFMSEMTAPEARDFLKKELFTNRDKYSDDLIEVMEYCVFHLRENRRLTESTVNDYSKRFGSKSAIIYLYEMANSLDETFHKLKNKLNKFAEGEDGTSYSQSELKAMVNTARGLDPENLNKPAYKAAKVKGEKLKPVYGREIYHDASLVETFLKIAEKQQVKVDWYNLILDDVSHLEPSNKNIKDIKGNLAHINSFFEETSNKELTFLKSLSNVAGFTVQDLIQQMLFELPWTSAGVIKVSQDLEFNNKLVNDFERDGDYRVYSQDLSKEYGKMSINNDSIEDRIDRSERELALKNGIANQTIRKNNIIKNADSYKNIKEPFPLETIPPLIWELDNRLVYSYIRLESIIITFISGLSKVADTISEENEDWRAIRDAAQKMKSFALRNSMIQLNDYQEDIASILYITRQSVSNVHEAAHINGINLNRFLNKESIKNLVFNIDKFYEKSKYLVFEVLYKYLLKAMPLEDRNASKEQFKNYYHNIANLSSHLTNNHQISSYGTSKDELNGISYTDIESLIPVILKNDSLYN